jgi:hypothetical protein
MLDRQRRQQRVPLAVGVLLLLLLSISDSLVGTNASTTIAGTKAASAAPLSKQPAAAGVVTPVTTTARTATSSSSAMMISKNQQGYNNKSPKNFWTSIRRTLNLSNTFGSPLQSKNPYDRILGNPVFAVTTPYGSPYLNMERLTDTDETIPSTMETGKKSSSSSTRSVQEIENSLEAMSDEQSEVRLVGLYFTDIDDAVAMQCEMKQLDNLKAADIRVSAFSMAKAIRQASVLGSGITTGAPFDDKTGRFVGTDGRLRYKIVPSKRQLYYAARCRGKERVGLCGTTANEDALLSILGNDALEGMNLQRRTAKRDAQRLQNAKATLSSVSMKKNKNQNNNPGVGVNNSTTTTTTSNIINSKKKHDNPMEGYCGIPVFTCANLQKRKFGRIEQPFFMNYEDLLVAWDKCRGKPLHEDPPSTTTSTPSTAAAAAAPVVEVFNLMDVLTSMDRENGTKNNNDRRLLHRITFVPNSRNVAYKEQITSTGNGKARLRPMR